MTVGQKGRPGRVPQCSEDDWPSVPEAVAEAECELIVERPFGVKSAASQRHAERLAAVTHPNRLGSVGGGRNRVPEVIALFWVTKALTTAFGESTSDYSVHAIAPVAAVLLGFVAFCVALIWQFRARRYVAARYWFAVAMVGVFGTMAADVLHVGFHVPYGVSAPLFALFLAAVFLVWNRTEGTLSVHTINTTRRECFYWAAVVGTFALGTAVGDLTATTFGLGYLGSALLFAGLILIPAIGYRFFGLNGIAAFWIAYVLTRPVGASIADWLGKPRDVGGLGWGQGPVALVLGALIVCCVSYLAITRADVPRDDATTERRTAAHAP